MITPTVKELIIIHINYRDVFNAAVNVNELHRWLGTIDKERVIRVLNELVAEGLVESHDNFNYWVTGRSEIARHQTGKKRLSYKCLNNHEKIIRYLSWMPFIRFIGISGSIAVNNATIHKDGLHKNAVDLDIFIITSANTLWIVFYIERFLTNLFIFFLGRRYVFCFNYAMDFSFLEIHNKSLFTATELLNLKPMYDSGNTYQLLLKSNSWAERYYPTLNSKQSEIKESAFKITSFGSLILFPINVCAFYFFHLSRVVKHFSFKPLTELSWEFNPVLGRNRKRINSPNGGYEKLIMERFENKLKKNFSSYYRTDLMHFLFPSQYKSLSVDYQVEKSVQEAFTKYNTA